MASLNSDSPVLYMVSSSLANAVSYVKRSLKPLGHPIQLTYGSQFCRNTAARNFAVQRAASRPVSSS